MAVFQRIHPFALQRREVTRNTHRNFRELVRRIREGGSKFLCAGVKTDHSLPRLERLVNQRQGIFGIKHAVIGRQRLRRHHRRLPKLLSVSELGDVLRKRGILTGSGVNGFNVRNCLPEVLCFRGSRFTVVAQHISGFFERYRGLISLAILLRRVFQIRPGKPVECISLRGFGLEPDLVTLSVNNHQV